MSRRLSLAAPIAITILVLGARVSRGDGICTTHGALDLSRTSLEGKATVDRGDGPSTAVAAPFPFSFGSSEVPTWSPVGRGDAVDIFIALVEGASDRPTVGIQCRRASFTAISSGVEIPLNELCGAVAPADGTSGAGDNLPSAALRVASVVGSQENPSWLVFDLSATEGIASGTSSLNAAGDGTVTITIDVPPITLTSYAVVDANSNQEIPDAPPVTIDFSAIQIRGRTTFAPRREACPPESGGCDCSGYYDGWLPGGG